MNHRTLGAAALELKEACHETVYDYLETCAKVEKEPQKPYSGKLMLSIPSELHAAITAAQVSGQSINQWISHILRQTSHI